MMTMCTVLISFLFVWRTEGRWGQKRQFYAKIIAPFELKECVCVSVRQTRSQWREWESRSGSKKLNFTLLCS
jgi:hypothetical protein